MRRVVATCVLLGVVAPPIYAAVKPAVNQQSNEKSLLARVTVYWASGGRGSDRYTRQHKSATGLRLRGGHCAVDPKHIPYGSQVVLPDGTKLAAVDTGTAVQNRKAARKAGHDGYERSAVVIDRFFETKRQAIAWANTHPPFMPVRVVTPNGRTAQAPLPKGTMVIRRGVAVNSPTSPSSQTKASNTTVASNDSSANRSNVSTSAVVSRNPLNRVGR
jgi:3D (Asp-Asp-Asp) domain-containing protein